MMKGLQSHFLFFFVLVAIPSILSTPPDGSETISAATKNEAIANNLFTFDLLKSLSHGEGEGKNVFYSPYSISAALALVSLGAAGKTLDEIGDALYFNEFHTNESITRSQQFTKPAIHKNNSSHEANKQHVNIHINVNVQRRNSDVSKYSLRTANRMYGNKSFEILESFQKIAQKNYHTELEQLDFQSGKAEGTINKWVEDQTNNKIKDMMQPGSLHDAQLVLVNAIYFKGSWKKKFEASDNRKQDFHLNANQKKEVDMMFVIADFKYTECPKLKTKALEMPYDGDEISMFVVLPDDNEGLAAVIQSLNQTHLQKMLKTKSAVRVHVSFPKFKLETEYHLEDTLSELGINDLFSDSADLSGISNRTKLKVSNVIHKAFVEVDEQGTEAAAATDVAAFAPAMGAEEISPLTFTVDHPFYFAIVDTRGGNILFSGTVSDP